MAVVFTGHEFAEGGQSILRVLQKTQVRASFFFTGDFYRNPDFSRFIDSARAAGHYLGAHSDRHLLYCDWTRRDSLLVSRDEFINDLRANYTEMKRFGISPAESRLFLPPFEWYNDSISRWTAEEGLVLVNFSSGTRSNADYTTPDMKNYRSSEEIMQSIRDYEQHHAKGLNGFILLLHAGTSPARTDKWYDHLEELIQWLRSKKYDPVRIDELLKNE